MSIWVEWKDGAVVDGDASDVGGVGPERFHLQPPLEVVGAGHGVQHHRARDRLQRQKISGRH